MRGNTDKLQVAWQNQLRSCQFTTTTQREAEVYQSNTSVLNFELIERRYFIYYNKFYLCDLYRRWNNWVPNYVITEKNVP